MRTWLSGIGAVLHTEIQDVRSRSLDLDPADLTRFTFPLVVRLIGVLAVGAVPLVVIRSSTEADHVTVPLLGSVALTLICTAVVAWLITILVSGLVLVMFYRTPPHAASRLVTRTVIDAFRRISDATALLVTLALVAGVVAVAIGLPSRRDREAAYSMIDDLLAAQVGVLLAGLALAFIAESIRCSAELIDKQSLLLAWPWALGISAAGWVGATFTGPFQTVGLMHRLLADWLPGTVDGVPQEQVIAEAVPPGAQWGAALAPLPVIAVIWLVEAQRHNGFHQMRQLLNRAKAGPSPDRAAAVIRPRRSACSVPAMPNAEQITETVHRYLDLVATGGAEDLAGLYADDATVEDPVGGEVHIGRQAIQGFYSAIEKLDRDAELVTLRVAGNEAAFHFRLTLTTGDSRMRIEPIDVMVFDDAGRVAAMKAYWSPENITQL